jgi:UDP-arabinose 4-epimerase
VRDYIDVTDLVDAHVKALNKAERGRVGIYNVGTGKGHPRVTFSLFTRKQRLRYYRFRPSSKLIHVGFVYSIFSGRSVKEFVEACKKATGVDIKVDYFPRRPGDYAEVYSDPAKINRELNWTAQHTDLHESLSVAWTWQKAHRSGYEPPAAVIL